MSIPEIDVTTANEKRAAGAFLLDVRQPDEYAEVHAPGVTLVPLGEVPDRVGELPTDTTVYVVCRSGGRSGKATEFLVAQGIDAVNVAGGMLAWEDAGLPTESGA